MSNYNQPSRATSRGAHDDSGDIGNIIALLLFAAVALSFWFS